MTKFDPFVYKMKQKEKIRMDGMAALVDSRDSEELIKDAKFILNKCLSEYPVHAGLQRNINDVINLLDKAVE